MRWLANVSLATAACLVVLGLGELVLRLGFAGDEAHELRGLHEFRPDRPWLYGLKPGARGRIAETGDALYVINEDGFRGARHARPKPPGTRRIVVLGDSVAFGYGVREEETFASALERKLGAHGGTVEVVNLGVGGYNAWNEVQLLADVGLSYEPDVIVVQFCINDLNDPTIHFDAQTRLALSAIPDAAFPDPSVRDRAAREPGRGVRACRRSLLCARAYDLWLTLAGPNFGAERRRAAVAPIEDAGRPEWQWLESRYREMATLAEAAGARFVVLAVPYSAQLQPGREVSLAPLVALAARNGWEVVEPVEAFRSSHARGERVLFDWWHPTAAGHRLIAARLAEVLGS